MDDEHDDDSAPEVQAGSEIETEAFADVDEDLEADDVRFVWLVRDDLPRHQCALKRLHDTYRKGKYQLFCKRL